MEDLISAIKDEDLGRIKYLIDKEGCGNTIDLNGPQAYNISSEAVQTGDVELVKIITGMLIKKKVDTEMWNPTTTPTLPMIACTLGYTDVVKYFLSNKMFVKRFQVKDKNERCCFMLSAKFGHDKIVELLVKSGHFDLHRRDRYGFHAIHIAAVKNYPEVIKTLVAQGSVDVDTRNVMEETPLMLAIKQENLNMCDVLLELGADRKAGPAILNMMCNNIVSNYYNSSDIEIIRPSVLKVVDKCIDFQFHKKGWSCLVVILKHMIKCTKEYIYNIIAETFHICMNKLEEYDNSQVDILLYKTNSIEEESTMDGTLLHLLATVCCKWPNMSNPLSKLLQSNHHMHENIKDSKGRTFYDILPTDIKKELGYDTAYEKPLALQCLAAQVVAKQEELVAYLEGNLSILYKFVILHTSK